MRLRTIIICTLLVLHTAIPLLIYQPAIGYDGVQYLQYANNLIETGRYSYDGITPSCGRAPGYPLFLAVFLWLFGSIGFVYAIQLILLFGTYYLVYRMAREYLTVAWSLGLLISLCLLFPMYRLALHLMSEPLFMFVATTSLFFLGRFLRTRKILFLALFAVLMTLSAFIRPVTALFGFYAALMLLITKRIGWRHALLTSLLTAVTLAPWTYRNWRAFGKIIPVASTYGSVYYMTDQDEFETILLHSAGASHSEPAYLHNVGEDFELDPPANDRFLKEAKANIARDPLGFLKRCVIKTAFIWSYLPGTKKYLHSNQTYFLVGMLLQLLFLVTVVVGWWRLRECIRSVATPPMLFASYHLLLLFPFYAESRYLVPVYIVLSGFSVFTLHLLWSWIIDHWRDAHALTP